MVKLSAFLIKHSTGWLALASLIIFLAFSALVLPGQSAAAEAYSGGLGSPDTSLIYTPQDLYRMAEVYGPAGRAVYIRARFTFDLIFPFVYGFFLTACLSWLLGKGTPPESRWRLLNLLPLAGVILDLLENISASIVIGRYPTLSPLPAALAPLFTFVKWIFVGGGFLALGILLVLLAARRICKK